MIYIVLMICGISFYALVVTAQYQPKNTMTNKKILLTALILSAIAWFSWGGVRVIQITLFEKNCSGFLKLAASANSVELAKENLKKALDYMERKDMTSGFTSVVYRTPDEDVGFWYRNVRASLDELETLSPTSTPLEKTNVLMKLRETLLDSGKSSEIVNAPDGISHYPNNKLMAFTGVTLSIILASMVLLGIKYGDD